MTDQEPVGPGSRISRKLTVIIVAIAVVLFSFIGIVAVNHFHPSPENPAPISDFSYATGSNGTYNVSLFLYNSNTGVPVPGVRITFHTPTFILIENTTSSGFANLTVHHMSLNAYNQLSGVNYTYSVDPHGSKYTHTGYVQAYENQKNPYFLIGNSTIWNGNETANGTMYYPRALFTVLLSADSTYRYNTVALQFTMGGLSEFHDVSVYYKPLANYSSSNASAIEGGGPAIYYFNNGSLNLSQPFPYVQPGYRYFSNVSGLTYLGTYKPLPVVPLDMSGVLHKTNTTRFLFVVFSPSGLELSWFVQQLYMYY